MKFNCAENIINLEEIDSYLRVIFCKLHIHCPSSDI